MEIYMAYVSIPVPEERVQEVYELLARPLASPTSSDSPSQFSDVDVRRMWTESGERMRIVLARLGDHPDEEFTAKELAKLLEVTTNQFSGVMGAFGHRVKSRYGWSEWPIAWRWDNEKSTVIYTMPSKVAVAMNAAR
jgi:hypothetical protein